MTGALVRFGAALIVIHHGNPAGAGLPLPSDKLRSDLAKANKRG